MLTGEQAFEDIVLNDLEWYAGHGIRLLLNRSVVKIDRRRRLVIAEDGTEAGYDRLVIATGSSPFILPVPGNRLPGVIGYRDIADTRQMIDSARTGSHAVVIGGGLLGLEAANGLRQRGMDVTVVHISDWLLERQLDRTAGRLLQQALEARGIHFRLGTHTEELLDHGTGHVCAVQVRGGEVIPADLVVMAAGIRPNIALAERAGLPCERGILVSDTLQTNDPRIYAIGECASHRGIAWPGGTAVRTGAGVRQPPGPARLRPLPGFGGLHQAEGHRYRAVLRRRLHGRRRHREHHPLRPHRRHLQKLVIRGGVLVGACLFGDTADGGWYFRQVQEQADISGIRDRLMFGEAVARPAVEPAAEPHRAGPARVPVRLLQSA